MARAVPLRTIGRSPGRSRYRGQPLPGLLTLAALPTEVGRHSDHTLRQNGTTGVSSHGRSDGRPPPPRCRLAARFRLGGPAAWPTACGPGSAPRLRLRHMIGRSIGRTTPWLYGRAIRHHHQCAPSSAADLAGMGLAEVVDHGLRLSDRLGAGLRAPSQPPGPLPCRLGRHAELFADLCVGEPRRPGLYGRPVRVDCAPPLGRLSGRSCAVDPAAVTGGSDTGPHRIEPGKGTSRRYALSPWGRAGLRGGHVQVGGTRGGAIRRRPGTSARRASVPTALDRFRMDDAAPVAL